MRSFALWAPAAAAAILFFAVTAAAADRTRHELRQGWAIQSSEKVKAKGAEISKVGFQTRDWHQTTVPTTVLAALVADGTYPDPYYGMNLRKIPGANYPIAQNFSNLPFPKESPFRASWWFRAETTLPASAAGERLRLRFDGVNYRANVWVNGKQIANAKEMVGTFRLFDFDVTGLVEPGRPAAVAVELFPPGPEELAITWVDWNPLPPDRNMGIWHDVYVTSSGAATVEDPQVVTDLESPELARLTVVADVRNVTAKPVTATVRAKFEKVELEQEVTLAPNERRPVAFAPEKFPALAVQKPRLWWPAQFGSPELYTLETTVEVGGKLSDRRETTFGIREITSTIEPSGTRVFAVNGRKILIRGGGWASDMMLRENFDRLEDEFRYVRDMNLNTIRLEGKLESDRFFELADRYGILVMAGWCCCDHWEHWDKWDDEDRRVAVASTHDQIRRLRNHPSMLVWLNGSDGPPPAEIEKAYLAALRDERWPNPYISSATAKPADVTGASGVKMTGPYDWVPPAYWLLDKEKGGAYNFNTETSPGPAVPNVESLAKMMPKEHLWPIDEVWNFHAGGGEFANLDIFTAAMRARYGEATSVEDYAMKSQVMTYEGERAMFEAYSRNRYASSGVIQWMLNDAWPSLIWHLYDYYLAPGGGYFGTKKACAPLHVQYSYDDRSVVAVNDGTWPLNRARVRATLVDADSKELFSKEMAIDLAPDAVVRLFEIPRPAGASEVTFLRLTLETVNGEPIDTNFYWLSAKEDVLDWKKAEWYYTPVASHADFTSLAKLAPAEIDATWSIEQRGKEPAARVTLSNPSKTLAFFVRLKLARSDGAEILPVRWEDNYVSLLPGERRTIEARYDPADAGSGELGLEVSGWNVAARKASHSATGETSRNTERTR